MILTLSEAADRLRVPLILVGILFWSTCALSLSLTVEERYCFEPANVPRDADGKISRSRAVIAFFRARHPCPSTGSTSGACDWEIDHVIPLACGGCDAVSNMAWMPPAIKSGPGLLPKDRWERRIYCTPMKITPVPR